MPKKRNALSLQEAGYQNENALSLKKIMTQCVFFSILRKLLSLMNHTTFILYNAFYSFFSAFYNQYPVVIRIHPDVMSAIISYNSFLYYAFG